MVRQLITVGALHRSLAHPRNGAAPLSCRAPPLSCEEKSDNKTHNGVQAKNLRVHHQSSTLAKCIIEGNDVQIKEGEFQYGVGVPN